MSGKSWHTFVFHAHDDKHKSDIGETVRFWEADQVWYNLPQEGVVEMQAVLVEAEAKLVELGRAYLAIKDDKPPRGGTGG